MPTTSSPVVVVTGLVVTWPDGRVALDGLDVTFPSGRTGLVGRNGSGKSTLLRVLSGDLRPTSGEVRAPADVAVLPQDLALRRDRTVADLLGVSPVRAAIAAVEAGDADPAHFGVIGDDWDVDERARAALDRFALPADLDRPLTGLSGGEAVLTAVAGLRLRRAAVTLLDEPSNNLDRRARRLLLDAVADWPGVLVVASHDRELLEHVERVVELHGNRTRTFTGPWSAYAAALAAEQDAAARAVRDAEGEVAREKRDWVDAQVVLARRERAGRTAEREKRVPKIVAHNRKREAQVSAAKHRGLHAGRLADARTQLEQAEQAVRDDDRIRVDLPDTAVPAGRDVVRVGRLVVRGPERIALGGPNGAGKTTLLEALAGRRPHPRHPVGRPTVPTAYLPQRLDVLDDGATVLDNVRAAAPAATPHEVRARLARFLVRGDAVTQPAGTLSGGERLRVVLATLLLADPAPQLLLLDEPTNNLDLDSVEQLVAALAGYRGAMIVVSHDEHVLADLGVTRRWEVRDLGLPVDAAGPA